MALATHEPTDGVSLVFGDLENFPNAILFRDRSGTAVILNIPSGDTFRLGIGDTDVFNVSVSAVGLPDDVSLELGTDDDSVLRHRTATLAANTGLTDVLAGTPVSAALAANSLMISNITVSGDIALYVNTGTVSEQAIFIDGSAKNLALGQTGWAVNVLNGAVKLTLGTVSAFGTTQPTNALVMRAGTAPAGAITTAGGLFSSTTVVQKIIADGTVSNVET